MRENRTPFISIRLFEHHREPELFHELLPVLKKHKEACDEVWFATDYGFPPILVHRDSARMMADAAAQIRELVIDASLQISNTLGHGDYLQALDFSGITWQRMVGHDGTVAQYSNCPRALEFHHYLRKTTQFYAAWRPDSVWIDDDLRMHHHSPVDWGCFCNRCLEEFSRIYGYEWTREELVKALHHSKDSTWRVRWVKFNQESLALVAGAVAEAVHEVSPETQLGLQHAGFDWSLYSGSNFTPIFDVLYKITGKPPLSRPGGGFYTDHAPRGMISKALSIHLQNVRLPKYVQTSRPEIENFTHTAMGKTPHGTVVESTLYLAYGCNALSYAILMTDHEKPAWHERTLERIGSWRGFWQRYVTHHQNTQVGGISIAYSGYHFAQSIQGSGNSFCYASPQFGNLAQMATLGLPLCWENGDNPAILLHPEAVDGLDEKQLRKIFSGGVITDGETVARLQRRGLSHLIGVEAEPFDKLDSIERLTNHRLNGKHKGRKWIQFGFATTPWVYRLLSDNSSSQVLGEYIRQDGTYSGVATLLINTPSGGRAAVFGYHFWEPVVSSARRAQILAAADWACYGKLPVFIDTPAQVATVPRMDAQGRLIGALLLNASIDYTPDLRVRLRNPKGNKAAWVIPPALENELTTQEGMDGEILVNIPCMSPWSVGVIELNE